MTNRKRKTIKLRIHASKNYCTQIGKQVSADGSKLVSKFFYLGKIREAAEKVAKSRVAEWNLMLDSWQEVYEPHLLKAGSPFASQPHWEPDLKHFLSEADIAANANIPVTVVDEAEANQESANLAKVAYYY